MSGYPPGMKLRPLDVWPGTMTKARRRSPFNATFTDTLTLLERELRLLDPKDRNYPPSVLQVAIPESKFRLDGMPRAGATPEHPGVIVSIEPRNKPSLSFPCDSFNHWHDNLRAIALTLEALRKMDRYGVTQTGQQYTGWQALPGPGKTEWLSADDAEAFLRTAAGADEGHGKDLGTLAQVYRRARANAHPDRNLGAQAQWDAVEMAANVLRAAGRLPS